MAPTSLPRPSWHTWEILKKTADKGKEEKKEGGKENWRSPGQLGRSFNLIWMQLLLLLVTCCQLQLDQISGGVVVDVVRRVHGWRPTLVIIDRWSCSGGGCGARPRAGGAQGSVHRGVVHHALVAVHRGNCRVSLGDLEDHPHVVSGAVSSDSPVQVGLGRGGDQVVALPWLELQPPGGRREGPEGDGEVLEPLLTLADRHYLRPGAGHPAVVKVLDGDAVDDMLLQGVLGADQVQLVVLPGQVALIHVNDVICVVNPEHRVRAVPVDKVCPHADHCGGL